MSDSPRETLLSLGLLSSYLSNVFTPYVIIVASLFTCAILVARYAVPMRMIIVLDKCVREVEDLYYDTCETQSFNFPEAENDLAARLIAIQDEAARLRIRTVRLTHAPGTAWWSECRGFFMGYSLAIWLCTSKIRALQRDLQLRQHKQLHALNAEFAAGNSPALQLRMRRRYCGSDSHRLERWGNDRETGQMGPNVDPAMRFIRDSARRVQSGAPGCGVPHTIGGVGLGLARISPAMHLRVAHPLRPAPLALARLAQDGDRWSPACAGQMQGRGGRLLGAASAQSGGVAGMRRATHVHSRMRAWERVGPQVELRAAGWWTARAGCDVAHIKRDTGDASEAQCGGSGRARGTVEDPSSIFALWWAWSQCVPAGLSMQCRSSPSATNSAPADVCTGPPLSAQCSSTIPHAWRQPAEVPLSVEKAAETGDLRFCGWTARSGVNPVGGTSSSQRLTRGRVGVERGHERMSSRPLRLTYMGKKYQKLSRKKPGQ
ncbi:hypothetical protein B0H10DRAFT_1941887 [Mycena sp. CBHHK59/15]|nr:hypothetical protein B0H10DRAFT_1941887 [Mycena sp. CBHHK59/15]